MFSQSCIHILRSQFALLQLQITIDDLTPPASAAVSAKVEIKQAKKRGYPVPPRLAIAFLQFCQCHCLGEEVKLGAIAINAHDFKWR